MNGLRRQVRLLGIAALGAGILLLAVFWWESIHGLTIPKIQLITTNGEVLDLQSLRGQALLVNFWSTSCSSCLKDIPQLAELYRDLSPAGVKLIGIAMRSDPPNFVLSTVEKRRIPYTVALDLDGEAAQAFGEVDSTPTSFLIAPNGRIVEEIHGRIPILAVRTRLQALNASTL